MYRLSTSVYYLTQWEYGMYSDFKQKLKDLYRPIIESNDRAYQMDHMDTVYNEAITFNEEFELKIPEKNIAIMAYCHGLFTRFKDNGHMLGFHHLMSTNEWFMKSIVNEERVMIAYAIKEYQESYKGDYMSYYSELLASADRGVPKSILDMLTQRYRYAYSKNNSVNQSIVYAIADIKNKFGNASGARYPDMYLKYYGKALDNRTKIIDKLIIPSGGFLELKDTPVDNIEVLFSDIINNALNVI